MKRKQVHYPHLQSSFLGKRVMRYRWQLLVGLWLSASIVSAQTGLQGFDANYPNTPAGDNPRGFTPRISPVTRPAPVPSPSTGPIDENPKPDPFTAPDPMMGEPSGNQAGGVDQSVDDGE